MLSLRDYQGVEVCVSPPPGVGRMANHTGRRFGMLVALQPAPNAPNRGARWLCQCDCGGQRVIPADTLVKGRVNSCGCATESFRQKHRIKHGHSRVGLSTGTYGSWHAMRQRCENESHKQYADYGGRGILVCERWADFRNFLADMGERPAGMTIDRQNANGNYEPENCRWATAQEQTLNQRAKVRHSDILPLIEAVEALLSGDVASGTPQRDRLAEALRIFRNRRTKA